MKNIIFRLLRSAPIIFFLIPFKPAKRWQNSYVLPKFNADESKLTSLDLPIPDVQPGYASTADFLKYGKEDVDSMLHILEETGFKLGENKRVLELGCATGRMLRWFADYANACEIWGTDVDADFVTWCSQHLSPPFSFFTCSSLPHLPFEDQYFDMIYAGSVFTHIDDLAETWLLELRRILKVGGRLYITIHDRSTMDVVNQDTDRKLALTKHIYDNTAKEYEAFTSKPFDKFTMGRGIKAQVFFDIDYLKRVTHSYFDIASVTPNAYGYQTAVVFKRKKT
jgi:ubiquinone/menaquinone biosynthesis C-methylase UbiE